jgi:aspartyl-tRNA(Asn)/glutamyl-tRNA(Gln) amidotransferase subunit C
MAITREQVQHVAMLFRMSMDDNDIARFQEQLSQIIDYFQILQEVDTEDIPPTAHTFALENVTRGDDVRPSFPAEDILANAPMPDRGFFRVRAVLE